MVVTTAAAIGLGIGAVGTVASVSASRKAAKAQQRQQSNQRRRSARQAIREAQIKRAQTVATAQGAGAIGSTAVAGGTGSLQSQLGGALGFASEQSALSGIISTQQSRANTLSSIASLGFTAAQTDFNKLFPNR